MNLNENGDDIVHIPQDLLVENTDSPLLSLVQFVYPNKKNFVKYDVSIIVL